jgi:aminoglycoside phosphotransferase (APT) family kinase protein
MIDEADVVASLEEFVAAKDPAMAGARVVAYEPIPGRYSKQTARFDVEVRGCRQSFVARADAPPGQSFFQTDLTAEWRLLSALTSLGSIPMPAARWFDGDGSALGSKTIVTEYHSGVKLTTVLDEGDCDHGQLADRLAEATAAVIAVGLETLPHAMLRPQDWDSWLDSRIMEFRRSEQALRQSDPVIRYVAAWLDAHRPPPVSLALVHGDLNPTNILVADDGSMCLLDWEFAHVGDPREDLGMLKLGGFFTPPDLLALAGESFLARYRELTGLTEEQLNPSVVAYFAILSSIEPVGRLLKQLGDYVTGANDKVMMAYSAILISMVHQAYMGFIAEAAIRLDAGLEAGVTQR